MLQKSRRWLVVSALVVVALVFVLFLATRPARWPPLPNPNGYSDFLSAAMLVTGDVYAASTNTHEIFRDFMTTNAEPLRRVRLGLTRQCSAPTEEMLTNIPGLMNDLPGLKRIGQLIAADGRLAEQENRIPDAAQSYVTGIRYGDELSRGGFIINRLVGVACEALSYNPLASLAPKLTCDEARPIITELEKIERDGVTWDEIAQNENSLVLHELRHYKNPVVWAMQYWQNRRAKKSAQDKHDRFNARLRLLTAELALRCYQADQGRVAQSLNELVPKYLQHLPEDPFSHRPLIYRPIGTNWLLYSVGVDRVDDGGKPVQRSVSGIVQKGDLFYNSPN